MTIQINLCICTVLCFVIVRIKDFASLAIKNVPSEDSDQTVQADLNLNWVHMSEGIFSDILTYSHHTWNKMIAVFNRKAPYSSKIDILLSKKVFDTLIYGINTIIKCGTWQP